MLLRTLNRASVILVEVTVKQKVMKLPYAKNASGSDNNCVRNAHNARSDPDNAAISSGSRKKTQKCCVLNFLTGGVSSFFFVVVLHT